MTQIPVGTQVHSLQPDRDPTTAGKRTELVNQRALQNSRLCPNRQVEFQFGDRCCNIRKNVAFPTHGRFIPPPGFPSLARLQPAILSLAAPTSRTRRTTCDHQPCRSNCYTASIRTLPRPHARRRRNGTQTAECGNAPARRRATTAIVWRSVGRPSRRAAMLEQPSRWPYIHRRRGGSHGRLEGRRFRRRRLWAAMMVFRRPRRGKLHRWCGQR